MGAPAGPQYIQVITSTGPEASATVEYYTTGGVAQNVFSDSTLITSLGNTLTADSVGKFQIHWLDPSLSYKRIIKLANGSTWRTDNPVQTADTSIATALADYLPLAGGNMSGPVNICEGASIASASTINLTTATGNTLHITGTTGISVMTLAQGERRLIFDDAVALTHSSNLPLPGSASFTTGAGDSCIAFAEGGGVTRITDYVLANGKALIEDAEILIKIGDETTALTTGTAKITFRMPFAMTLDQIPRASLTTAQASGSIVTFDINETGVSILSTKLSIDNAETTSASAATPAVLSDTSLADDAAITIDIDQCDGSTAAAGAAILLRGYRRNRS